MKQGSEFIYGPRPVIEAIDAGQEIDRVYLKRDLQGEKSQHILKLLKERSIPFQFVPVEKLNRITRKNHQGIIATVSPVTFQDLDQVIPAIYESGRDPLIVMLDGVTDVRNFGAIARTAECAGVHAIILPYHGSARINADETAVILCTSGTTGDPREVELTHANLIANIAGSVEKVEITGEDKLGHILPPHHSFGLTVGKLLPFCVGATNIYTNKYRQVSELIREKSITIFVAIPALFTVLAKKIEENLAREKEKRLLVRLLDHYLPKRVGKSVVEKLGWTNLRFFLSGAAAMPRWVLEVFWKRGLKLCEGYGTTENSPVYGFNDDPQRLGSVGKPISTLSVQIVNERNEIMPPGIKGEICLGGPCIMKGYYKNPQATKSVIRIDSNGIRWLHTGDLGYLDEEGHLFITGRKKYLIVLPGGKNVNPELVESALSEARFVGEILVVPGLRKDTAGIPQETVRAIVKPALDEIAAHTNLSHNDLVKQPKLLKSLVWQSISECQRKSRQLSIFEKINSRHLEIKIDEFQKTSTGKIKREAYIKL